MSGRDIRHEVLDARLNAKYHAYMQARHGGRARPVAVLLFALTALTRVSWTSGWFLPYLVGWLVGGLWCTWEFRRAYLHRRLRSDWQSYRHHADTLLRQVRASHLDPEMALDSRFEQLKKQRVPIEQREPQPPDRSLLAICQREVQAEIRPAPGPSAVDGSTPGAGASRKGNKPVFLVLTTCPRGVPPLQLADEIAVIEEQLGRGGFSERYNIVTVWQPTAKQIVELVTEHAPTILHIGGHADIKGILTEAAGTTVHLRYDEKGIVTEAAETTVHLRYDELARCFAVSNQAPRLVVLNVCFSGEATTDLAKHVDAVIGMRHEISDPEARNFARSLYHSLVDKRSIQEAFDIARKESDAHTPHLTFKPGVNPQKIVF